MLSITELFCEFDNWKDTHNCFLFFHKIFFLSLSDPHSSFLVHKIMNPSLHPKIGVHASFGVHPRLQKMIMKHWCYIWVLLLMQHCKTAGICCNTETRHWQYSLFHRWRWRTWLCRDSRTSRDTRGEWRFWCWNGVSARTHFIFEMLGLPLNALYWWHHIILYHWKPFVFIVLTSQLLSPYIFIVISPFWSNK